MMCTAQETSVPLVHVIWRCQGVRYSNTRANGTLSDFLISARSVYAVIVSISITCVKPCIVIAGGVALSRVDASTAARVLGVVGSVIWRTSVKDLRCSWH